MSAIRIYYVYVGYIIFIYFYYLKKYGQIICNILELRLFLYLSFLVVITSPFGMNTVTFGVLMVERMINICGRGLIYIAIYIRFEY